LVKNYVKLAEEGKSLTSGKAPSNEGKLGQSGMELLEDDLHVRPRASYERRAGSFADSGRKGKQGHYLLGDPLDRLHHKKTE
jgi:hypothetical protein